jgi:23S rRNA G2445 N2-methylase RlmL
MIKLTQGSVSQWLPEASLDTLVTNPPWGLRLSDKNSTSKHQSPEQHRASSSRGEKHGDGDGDDEAFLQRGTARHDRDLLTDDEMSMVESTWRDLGLFLKRACHGRTAYVLCRDASGSLKGLHLKPSNKTRLRVGGVDCNLLEYGILPPKGDKIA